MAFNEQNNVLTQTIAASFVVRNLRFLPGGLVEADVDLSYQGPGANDRLIVDFLFWRGMATL